MDRGTQQAFLKSKSFLERLQFLFGTRALYFVIAGSIAFAISVFVIGSAFYSYLDHLREEHLRNESIHSALSQVRAGALKAEDDISLAQASLESSIYLVDQEILLKSAASKLQHFIDEITTIDWDGRNDVGSIIHIVDDARADVIRVEGTVSGLPDSDQKKHALQAVLPSISARLGDISNKMYDVFVAARFRYVPKSSLDEHVRVGFKFNFNIIPFALADTLQPGVTAPYVPHFSQDDAKLFVFVAIFVVLLATFVLSIIAVFTTKNATVLSFSLDTVKTLLGFFIGAATAFLGLPAVHS